MAMDEKESGLAAMIENLQRQDLDFVEEAAGIANLMEKWKMSQDQAARMLGKSQSAVANKLRLLRHSQPVLDALRSAGLTERHARALLKLPSETEKLKAIAVIARQNFSVARTESYIESLLAGTAPAEAPVDLRAFLNHLSTTLQKIQRSGIPAVTERRETDRQIVLTITIPK
jgi:ParB family chromosome partitioning protein